MSDKTAPKKQTEKKPREQSVAAKLYLIAYNVIQTIGYGKNTKKKICHFHFA